MLHTCYCAPVDNVGNMIVPFCIIENRDGVKVVFGSGKLTGTYVGIIDKDM